MVVMMAHGIQVSITHMRHRVWIPGPSGHLEYDAASRAPSQLTGMSISASQRNKQILIKNCIWDKKLAEASLF